MIHILGLPYKFATMILVSYVGLVEYSFAMKILTKKEKENLDIHNFYSIQNLDILLPHI